MESSEKMSVLKSLRIVELSHRMIPGQEEFPLQIKTFNTDEVMAKTARAEEHRIERRAHATGFERNGAAAGK